MFSLAAVIFFVYQSSAQSIQIDRMTQSAVDVVVIGFACVSFSNFGSMLALNRIHKNRSFYINAHQSAYNVRVVFEENKSLIASWNMKFMIELK